MYEDQDNRMQREDLQNLLNFSDISEGFRESHFHQFSASRIKLNTSEKERTREQSYDDIMKQIHFTKLEKIELQRKREELKQGIFKTYLWKFNEEFDELNQQNTRLRLELNQTKKKINDDNKSERHSIRSSIKPRKSFNSTYGDENIKTNTKNNRNQVSPMVKRKEVNKLTESTAHLGRSQVQSPHIHKRRQSQLTERKAEENNNSIGVSVNISILDEKCEQLKIRQSVSRHFLNDNQPLQSNIFVEFLQKILYEQKSFEKDRYHPLSKQLESKQVKEEAYETVVYINDLQGQIKGVNQKLQMLSLVLEKYQSQMENMNMSLRNVQEWTQRLLSVKGRYIDMEKKCTELMRLRRQVSDKQDKMIKIKLQSKPLENQNAIPSIETMIKIITNNPNKSFAKSTKLYNFYYKQIKEIFKFDKQQQNKRFQRIVKVKDTIDTIRQGRKKFNELIFLYEGRIAKLQQKITRLRFQNEKLQKR